MPLSMVSAGNRVRLVGVHAGRGLQGRLAALGLVPGVEIEVVSKALRGPCVLAVKGSRVMIGRGMAHKIMVEQIPFFSFSFRHSEIITSTKNRKNGGSANHGQEHYGRPGGQPERWEDHHLQPVDRSTRSPSPMTWHSITMPQRVNAHSRTTELPWAAIRGRPLLTGQTEFVQLVQDVPIISRIAAHSVCYYASGFR